MNVHCDKPKEQQASMDFPREEAPNEFSQQGAAGEQLPDPHNLADLSNLLRDMMQQQSDRETKWEQERQRQEERWKRIQHEFIQLQQEVQLDCRERQQLLEGAAAAPGTILAPTVEQPGPQPVLSRPDPPKASVTAHSSSPARFLRQKGPKMQPYHEDEDTEQYLTFERIATACQWPQKEWALHLAPLLNGKARAAYVAMDIEETMDYAKMKSAVHEKFVVQRLTE